MEFTSFKDAVKNAIECRVGGDCTVDISDAAKNNGIMLSGLTVKTKDSNASPIIYLNRYYQAYESGDAEFKTIINDIFNAYEKNKLDHVIDMNHLLNYEKIRKKVVYKLINSYRNAELLQYVPHIAFHDLSIVFQILVDEEGFENATILIRNEYLTAWNISLDELYKDARNNTPILNKYEVKNIDDIIRELTSTAEMVLTPVPLLMLSNKNRLYGAACMLYPDLLKHISNLTDSSMYIIPSSIHEILLLPTKKVTSSEYKFIEGMICEVNNTQVAEEEILSYSVYFYDKNTDEIIKL